MNMADMKVNETDLDNVVGGTSNENNGNNENADTKKSICPVCNAERTFLLGTGGRAYCEKCGHEKFM